MNKNRILLLGAGGQLGKDLIRPLSTLGEVKALTRDDVNFNYPSNLYGSLVKVSESFRPSIVVNAAAYTNVDQSELNISEANLVNAVSPRVIAEFSEMVGAIVVHYSTDYVFNGSGVKYWSESDAADPLSIYGNTKYEGECGVQKSCKKHLIIRTSWLMSSHGCNFISTILELATKHESLKVVNDQIGAPTSTQQLADVTVGTLKAMQLANEEDTRWGTYHVAAAGETSWHGYAQHVIAGALQRGAKLKATPSSVLPITTAEYPLPAPRPLNSRLNTDKLKTTFGLTLHTWQQGVDEVLDELLKEKTA